MQPIRAMAAYSSPGRVSSTGMPKLCRKAFFSSMAGTTSNSEGAWASQPTMALTGYSAAMCQNSSRV